MKLLNTKMNSSLEGDQDIVNIVRLDTRKEKDSTLKCRPLDS